MYCNPPICNLNSGGHINDTTHVRLRDGIRFCQLHRKCDKVHVVIITFYRFYLLLTVMLSLVRKTLFFSRILFLIVKQ